MSLLNLTPEIAWTFLKNAQIIAAKFPKIFENIRLFFTNFNDPIFIKIEKIKIMYELSDSTNLKIIINEFSEYSYDTCSELSTFAFNCLWKLGLKFGCALDFILS